MLALLIGTQAFLVAPPAPLSAVAATHARPTLSVRMQEEPPKRGPPKQLSTPLTPGQETFMNSAVAFALCVPLISAAFSPDGLSHKLWNDVSDIPVVGGTLGSLEGKFKGPPGLDEAVAKKKASRGDSPLAGALKGWSVKEKFGGD